MNAKPESSQSTTSERTPYRTPKLVRYGKLASLVQSGCTPGTEDALFTSIPF